MGQQHNKHLERKATSQDKSGDKNIGVKGTVPIRKKSALAGTFFNIRDMYLKNRHKVQNSILKSVTSTTGFPSKSFAIRYL